MRIDCSFRVFETLPISKQVDTLFALACILDSCKVSMQGFSVVKRRVRRE